MTSSIAITFAITAVFVASVIPAQAQVSGKTYHVAILQPTGSSGKEGILQWYAKRGLMSTLAQGGFVEGHNLVFEAREGALEQLPDLAHELVKTHPDVILTVGLVGARAAHGATETIPIIATSSFLLDSGLVASLARPGGNVSGVSFLTTELDEKRLALLHELLPGGPACSFAARSVRYPGRAHHLPPDRSARSRYHRPVGRCYAARGDRWRPSPSTR